MRTKDMLNRKLRFDKSFNLISIPEISLPPAEADQFLTYITDQSVFQRYARVVKMDRPEQEIDAIGFGTGEFLFPAKSFNEAKYKKQFIHNRITLRSQEFRGALAIFDRDVEDIKYRMSEDELTNMYMGIITKKIANQLDLAYYIADSHGLNGWGVDDIRSTFDGWRYIINHSALGGLYYNNVTGSAHIKHACLCESGPGCDEAQQDPDAEFRFAGMIVEQDPNPPYNLEIKYHRMIKNMPSQYKQDPGLGNMVFLNSDLVTQDYLESLSQRIGSALADAVILGKQEAVYGKVPIIDVPLMPTNLGQDADLTFGLVGGNAYTDVLLTPKNNLIVGMQLDVKIETERSAKDQATYVYYTMRATAAIENVDAIVFLNCLLHRC
jgi:hypothetical protein